MIIDTKKHENRYEARNNVNYFFSVFSCGLKILVLFSVLLSFNFSYAVTVAPAKIEFNVNPGEEIKFSIYTRNDGEATTYLYSVVKGFTKIDFDFVK
jgi:hypothetical protein